MKLNKIRTVERGRYTPQLQRKKWNRYLAKEECAFAIIGRERTVDLEASNVRKPGVLILYTHTQLCKHVVHVCADSDCRFIA